MLENVKPAQPIKVTITRTPSREDQRQTISRLMRQDPDVKKALKRSQEHRARTARHKIRGGRRWAIRQPRTLVARVEEGASWTMPYFPQLANDLNSVSEFLDIKAV